MQTRKDEFFPALILLAGFALMLLGCLKINGIALLLRSDVTACMLLLSLVLLVLMRKRLDPFGFWLFFVMLVFHLHKPVTNALFAKPGKCESSYSLLTFAMLYIVFGFITLDAPRKKEEGQVQQESDTAKNHCRQTKTLRMLSRLVLAAGFTIILYDSYQKIKGIDHPVRPGAAAGMILFLFAYLSALKKQSWPRNMKFLCGGMLGVFLIQLMQFAINSLAASGGEKAKITISFLPDSWLSLAFISILAGTFGFDMHPKSGKNGKDPRSL